MVLVISERLNNRTGLTVCHWNLG